MKSMKTFKGRGFTLIELLVVISIVALLLSILIPSLKKARENAKDVICRTNIKSMQLATTLYTDDFDGKMPIYDLSGLWVNLISEYLDDVDQARYCPSTTIDKARLATIQPDEYQWGSSKRSWIWYWGTPEPETGSYGLSSWFYTLESYPNTADGDRYFRTMSDVRHMARTPVFADSLWIDVGVRDTDYCPDELSLEGSPNLGGRMSMHLINRHGFHINVGFADGHQQTVELGALWSLKWYNNFKTQAWVTRTPSGDPIYPGPR